MDDYRALYPDTPTQHRVALDASVRYMASDYAISDILAHRPDARFIAVFRDPLEAVPAFHRQLVMKGGAAHGPIEQAWLNPGYRRTLTRFYYYDRIFRDNLSQIPPQQFYYIDYISLTTQPHRTLSDLLAFLNCDFEDGLELPKTNVKASPRLPPVYRRFMQMGQLARRTKKRLGIDRDFGIFRQLRRPLVARGRAEGPSPEFVDVLKDTFCDDLSAFERRTGLHVRGPLWSA